MSKYLVIVESPTKVKTIEKFLGSNYSVVASNGPRAKTLFGQQIIMPIRG